jgi:diacylglycerol kinase (ATP)
MTTGSAPRLPKVDETAPEPAPGHANSLRSSFGYAFAGLAYCFRTQRNFRIHIALAIAATLLGLLLGLTWAEWAVLTTTMVLVLSAEMVNTMIESLVDLVTVEYHPLAKIAKDVAAGVVLLTAIGAVVVGLVIFGPRLLAAVR